MSDLEYRENKKELKKKADLRSKYATDVEYSKNFKHT